MLLGSLLFGVRVRLAVLCGYGRHRRKRRSLCSNSILFEPTFASFMVLVHVPVFVEDMIAYGKELANELYDSTVVYDFRYSSPSSSPARKSSFG